MSSLPEAFYALESDFYNNILCKDTSTLIIHASAVVHVTTRQTIVLPGASHCGKSTLAAALAASGRFLYLGEEAIGLDCTSNRLLSYTKPVKLRFGAEHRILADGSWPCLRVSSLNFTYAIPPQPVIATEVDPEVPFLFVFPTFAASVKATLERVSPAMAIAKLATYSVNPPQFLTSHLETVSVLQPGRASWDLTWSSWEEVVKEIDCLCFSGWNR